MYGIHTGKRQARLGLLQDDARERGFNIRPVSQPLLLASLRGEEGNGGSGFVLWRKRGCVSLGMHVCMGGDGQAARVLRGQGRPGKRHMRHAMMRVSTLLGASMAGKYTQYNTYSTKFKCTLQCGNVVVVIWKCLLFTLLSPVSGDFFFFYTLLIFLAGRFTEHRPVKKFPRLAYYHDGRWTSQAWQRALRLVCSGDELGNWWEESEIFGC